MMQTPSSAAALAMPVCPPDDTDGNARFLSVRGIDKRFGAFTALDGVSLEVRQGEMVCLLGPSGCGKTTLLRTIAGLERQDAGQIFAAGRDISDLPPQSRDYGILFQSYALFPNLTVADNVAYGLRNMKRQARQERVTEMLSMVGLAGSQSKYPGQLSGGQQQRVALARALVIAPPVLLLDEPLSNLDAKLREEMQFELRDIQRKVGTTTIMVTHDQSEAMSISDRVVVMEAGHITQVGRPLNVYEHPANRFISTFVGKANLLEGQVVGAAGERADIAVGGMMLSLESTDTGLRGGGRVVLGLRPEKIRCTAPGQGRCNGEVVRRFFLGSQWMYEVETPLGLLSVLSANDGAEALEQGAAVGLAWSDYSLRLVSTARSDEGVAA